ncbi:MAG: carbohydrate-binding domain-containing protein [Paludibacteraceae bacterium]|nr:carbohydrate-binding domain-containing protein [Paludibacteraceae bacterium]
MKKLWIILTLALAVLTGTGCKQNSEVDSGSTGSDTTNTGDDSSDFVDEQTWNTTINLVWNGTDVTVTGSADGVTITNSNGYVTVTSTAKHIEYAVSGSGTGQLSIYSDYKYKLSLEGLTLACSDGPAINNQCSKTCYAVLGGTNTLSDGASYASSFEDRKAAFFSEGQICFSGSGSLAITGNYKHALASDDYIRLCSGTGVIDLTSKVSDGMHANDGIIINDGTLTINAADEGIQCDESSVLITGGTVTVISQTEGIEAKGVLEISGGRVFAQANDDAINSGGDMTISGGFVMAYSTGNDGLDANGNCYIKGGIVYAIGASSPEVAIDANTEERKQLYVQGGTIVAIGGLESGASLSQTCYSASSVSKNTWYALYSGSDLAFVFKTPSSLSASTFVVSTGDTASLKSGVTTSGGSSILNSYALSSPTVSGGNSVTLSSYSGGNSGGGPGGGGPGGRPGGW